MARSIVYDEDRRNGRPVLEGTRIGVHQLCVMLRDDDVSPADVVDAFPKLDGDDIQLALSHAENHRREMAEIEWQKEQVRERADEEGEVVDIRM